MKNTILVVNDRIYTFDRIHYGRNRDSREFKPLPDTHGKIRLKAQFAGSSFDPYYSKGKHYCLLMENLIIIMMDGSGKTRYQSLELFCSDWKNIELV